MLNLLIIGDRDRKRAPFLVLGLPQWYEAFYRFLEQIGPSYAVHARICWVCFCGWSAGEMASEIPEMFKAFDRQLNKFMSVGISLQCFCRKLHQFEWSNISQHCWAQHVACVWPPCCHMLGVVGSNLKIVKFFMMLHGVVVVWPGSCNNFAPGHVH